MSSRPRRSAAQRATVAITDMADRDMSSRTRRSADAKGVAGTSRVASSPPGDSQHMHLTVKVPSSKLRQATTSSRAAPPARRAVSGKAEVTRQSQRPTRGATKRYVELDSEDEDEDEDDVDVADDDDEEEDDDEEDEDDEDEVEESPDEIKAGEDDEEPVEGVELGEEDAEGELVDDDEMDVDAEGEDDDVVGGDADAEGDTDMDGVAAPPPPVIKVSRPVRSTGGPGGKARSANAAKGARKASAVSPADEDEEDLSDADSEVDDEANNTAQLGGQDGGDEDAEGELEEEDIDMDAEGEDIEGAEDDDDDELGSGGDTGDGSRGETPDLTKMTRRQRARFEDKPQEYMKLSDGRSPGPSRAALRPLANAGHRGPGEEAVHRRGAGHAAAGNGPPPAQPQREAKRGGQGKAADREQVRACALGVLTRYPGNRRRRSTSSSRDRRQRTASAPARTTRSTTMASGPTRSLCAGSTPRTAAASPSRPRWSRARSAGSSRGGRAAVSAAGWSRRFRDGGCGQLAQCSTEHSLRVLTEHSLSTHYGYSLLLTTTHYGYSLLLTEYSLRVLTESSLRVLTTEYGYGVRVRSTGTEYSVHTTSCIIIQPHLAGRRRAGGNPPYRKDGGAVLRMKAITPHMYSVVLRVVCTSFSAPRRSPSQRPSLCWRHRARRTAFLPW